MNPLDEINIPIKKTFMEWMREPNDKTTTLNSYMESIGFNYTKTNCLAHHCESKEYENVIVVIDEMRRNISVYYNDELTEYWTYYINMEKNVKEAIDYLKNKEYLKTLVKSN